MLATKMIALMRSLSFRQRFADVAFAQAGSCHVSHQLPSSADRLFQALKSELTLGLFLRDGAFWTAIEGIRSKWKLQVPTCVPTEEDHSWPRVISRLASAPEESTLHQLALGLWGADLCALHDAFVPVELQRGNRRLSRMLWLRFISNCVLNDPPEEHLIEFAATGSSMATSYSLVDPRDFDPSNWRLAESPGELTWMVGTPLIQWPQPDALIEVEQWFRKRLLAEIGRRYLEPIGVDIGEAVEAIFRATSLNQEYRERSAAIPLQPVILVDAETTKQDVLGALQLIKATQSERSSGGRPPVDDLTAVQCAIWSETGMTQRAIAERLGLSLQPDEHGNPYRSDQVRYRINRGREILSRRKNPTE